MNRGTNRAQVRFNWVSHGCNIHRESLWYKVRGNWCFENWWADDDLSVFGSLQVVWEMSWLSRCFVFPQKRLSSAAGHTSGPVSKKLRSQSKSSIDVSLLCNGSLATTAGNSSSVTTATVVNTRRRLSSAHSGKAVVGKYTVMMMMMMMMMMILQHPHLSVDDRHLYNQNIILSGP